MEQLLLLHFAPFFLIRFDLAQYLDQRFGRRFSQALLQRTWHRQHCHDSTTRLSLYRDSAMMVHHSVGGGWWCVGVAGAVAWLVDCAHKHTRTRCAVLRSIQSMLKKRVEGIVHGATDVVAGALDARANSISVRPDDESLKRIDELVEADVFSDRSSATTFLVTEGIKANADMFAKIQDGFAEIRRVKEQLRNLRGADAEGEEAGEA